MWSDFGDNDVVIYAVGQFKEDQDAIFFLDGIPMLENDWMKLIDVKQVYTDK